MKPILLDYLIYSVKYYFLIFLFVINIHAKANITHLDAAILGSTEGATEFLPISSSAHLIIVSHFLGLDSIEDPLFKESLNAFLVIIQFGAILAVLFILKNQVKLIWAGFSKKNPQGIELIKSLILAFIPTGIIGFLGESYIEKYFRAPIVLIAALCIGGLFMLLVDLFAKKLFKSDKLTLNQAFLIGCMQSLALCPGTSRSMMTICAGILLGLSFQKSLEFSFLLGVITISVASIYKIASQCFIIINYLNLYAILIGIGTAFIISLLFGRIFIWFLPRYGLKYFAIYRVLLAAFLYYIR